MKYRRVGRPWEMITRMCLISRHMEWQEVELLTATSASRDTRTAWSYSVVWTCLFAPTFFFATTHLMCFKLTLSCTTNNFFSLVSSTRRWKAPRKVFSRHQQAKFKGPHFLHERTPFQSCRCYCCGRGGQGVRSRWVYNRGSAWSKIYSPSYSYLTAFIIEDVGLVITVMAAIRQERKDYLIHKSTTLETTMWVSLHP